MSWKVAIQNWDFRVGRGIRFVECFNFITGMKVNVKEQNIQANRHGIRESVSLFSQMTASKTPRSTSEVLQMLFTDDRSLAPYVKCT